MLYERAGLVVFGCPGESEPFEGRFKILESSDRPTSKRGNQCQSAHTPVWIPGVDERQTLDVRTSNFAKQADALRQLFGSEIASNTAQVQHCALNAAFSACSRQTLQDGAAPSEIQFTLGANPDEFPGANELDFKRHVFPPLAQRLGETVK